MGRASLKMDFGGYAVVPDLNWPKMYAFAENGSITDMVNLSRARDAARNLAWVEPISTMLLKYLSESL